MKKQAANSDFDRNTATLVSGTVIAQIIPIALTPLLTRLYSPSSFGALGAYIACVAVLAVIAGGRYEQAILLPKSDDDALQLSALSAGLTAIFCVIIAFIILFFSDRIFGNENINSLDWIVFVPFGVMVTSFYQICNLSLNRMKNYTVLSTSRIIQALIIISAQILIGYKFQDRLDSGLIIGTLIGLSITCIILFLSIILDHKGIIFQVKMGKMLTIGKRYIDFPRIALWSGLLNTASVQVPVILFAQFFNQGMVGMYSLANRMLNIPMSILGGSIGQVYSQKISSEISIGVPTGKTTYSVYSRLLLIGLIPALATFTFGEDIFSFIFGRQWAEAGHYAEILSPWFFFVFISSPLSNLLTILEKHKENILFNALLFASRAGVIVVGALLFRDDELTIIMFSTVGTVLWAIFTYYILRLAEVEDKLIIRSVARFIAPSIIVSVLVKLLIK